MTRTVCILTVVIASMLAAGPAAAQPTKDLQVTSLSVQPTSQTAGGTVNISYRLYNAGNSTTALFQLRFYYSTDATITTSDTLLYSMTPGSLAGGAYYPPSANGSVNVTLPGSLTPGSGYIGAIVDVNDDVVETDETNNTKATPITILAPPKPDLQVSVLSIAPTSAAIGGSVTITYRVHNAGTAAAGTSFLRFYHSTDATITTSDTYINGEAIVGAVAAGADYPASNNGTVNVTLPGTVPTGSGYIGAIVDYTDVVTESNETNNTKATPITVLTAQPDLEVTTLSVTPTSQTAGGSVNITYRVHNAGTAAAGAFHLRFYHSTDATITTSDTYLNSDVPITSLAAGASFPSSANGSVNVTLPGSVPAGAGYIGAIVDSNNTVTESNETNNTKATPFTVLAPTYPDLEVTSLSVTPTSQTPGGSVAIGYRVHNAGSAAAGTFTLRFYHSTDATITTSDTYVSQVQVFGLNAGAYYPGGGNGTKGATLPTSLLTGPGYIGAIVDYDNSVTESDETNNTKATPITILAPAKPDLQLSTLSVAPTSAAPGGSVTVTYRVNNAGAGAAGGFHVRFYYSTDATISTSDTYLNSDVPVASLAAGANFPASNNGSVSVTLPSSAAAGTRYIGAIVDYDDSVAESDETNNTKAAAITVLSGGGTTCTSASQCSTGHCVDGVCCDTACGGGVVDCQACSTSAGGPVNGTCSVLASTVVCRPAAGICDEPESCTGASPTCPTDLFKISGTTCRVAADLCDAAEVCSGSSADCPTDVFKSVGAVCRAAAGECDVAEQCVGTVSCPSNIFKADGTACTGGLCSGGVCVATADSGVPDQGLDAGADIGMDAGVDIGPEAGVDASMPDSTSAADGPVIDASMPDSTTAVDGPTIDGAVIPADSTAADAALPTDGSTAADAALPADGSAAPDSGTGSDDDEGCSCELGARPGRGGAALCLLLLLGLVLWRRRD